MLIAPWLKQLVRRTGILFAIFLIAKIIPYVFDFPLKWDKRINDGLHLLAVLAIFFQAILWSNALVNHWRQVYIDRHRDEYGAATTIGAVAAMVRVLFVVLLSLMALKALSIDITPFIAGLGISGIAIAFALQNILGDLFGALSIVLDKPFVVGDAIQVDTFSGRVERIGLKSTRVRADTGEQMIFANGDLLKGRLRNFQRMHERRVTMATRVAGDTPPDELERIPDIIKELVKAQPNTRFARSHLKQIGDTTIDFETVYFLADPAYDLMMNTQQAIQLALLRRLQADGITMNVALEAGVKKKTAGLI